MTTNATEIDFNKKSFAMPEGMAALGYSGGGSLLFQSDKDRNFSKTGQDLGLSGDPIQEEIEVPEPETPVKSPL